MTETLAHGTHRNVLSTSFLMNTNMTGFRWFQKSLHHCAMDERSLSIGSVILIKSTSITNLNDESIQNPTEYHPPLPVPVYHRDKPWPSTIYIANTSTWVMDAVYINMCLPRRRQTDVFSATQLITRKDNCTFAFYLHL